MYIFFALVKDAQSRESFKTIFWWMLPLIGPRPLRISELVTDVSCDGAFGKMVVVPFRLDLSVCFHIANAVYCGYSFTPYAAGSQPYTRRGF